MKWIDFAMAPNFGGTVNFANLSTKSELLRKLGRASEAEKTMAEAVEKGTAIELHGYGRQLLGQKKPIEALAVFQKNWEKNAGAWPTNVGLARGFSANGDLKKALEHARKALPQAPDDLNRTTIEAMIKNLEAGKAI